MFWNYLSVGMDAEAAHGFHRLRETRPQLTTTRMANQFWYGYYSCTSGWFCCSSPINQRLRLLVQDHSGDWKEVALPNSVKAIVLVNLQSYAGGWLRRGRRCPFCRCCPA
jgi:diacylglycerol kinase (ATP)